MNTTCSTLLLALLAAAIPGCRSTAPDPPSEPAAARATRELSAEEQALLEAYGKGGEEWDRARARALLDPELERFLIDRLVLEMVRAYEGIARPGGETASAEFDRAQAELVRLGERSAPVLAGLLALSDGGGASLAARTLERIGRPGIEAVLPLTGATPVRTRLRAAEVLERLPHAGGREAQVRAALTSLALDDPDWTVRAQAARSLGERGSRDRLTEPARRTLERVLSDPDPAVSEAAAVGLARLGDPLAVPALIERLALAVEQGDLRAVRACQGALRTVTQDPRERDLEGWQRWWYEHRDEIQRSQGPR